MIISDTSAEQQGFLRALIDGAPTPTEGGLAHDGTRRPPC